MPSKKDNRFGSLFVGFDEAVKQVLKDIPNQLEGLETPNPPKGGSRQGAGRAPTNRDGDMRND
jgi:hypothetical protein